MASSEARDGQSGTGASSIHVGARSRGDEHGAPDDELDELVRLVAAGADYRGLSRDLIASVGARELAKRRTLKEAVKTTRSKLHQVTAAYFPRQDYAGWLALLREAAASGNREELRAACRTIMRQHASTRERLPVLDDLYTRTLSALGPISSVTDVACGLNPLAIPWMPLAPNAEYRAYDVYPELAAFLNEALPLLGVRGAATVMDVTATPPTERTQVALICKALPCLEQLDKTAGNRLLDALDASYVLVTYPVRSLGGHGKGMLITYDAQLRRLVAGRGWRVERHELATELAFVLSRE